MLHAPISIEDFDGAWRTTEGDQKVNMPSINVYCPSGTAENPAAQNPLPQLLQTPSGLAMLELQGTIHVPSSSDHGDVEMTDIHGHYISTPAGKLLFPVSSQSHSKDDTAWMKRVYLYVGKHQRLTGEVKKLPKPMGIMRKRTKDDSEDAEELQIVEIIRYKIVFASRPEPVSND